MWALPRMEEVPVLTCSLHPKKEKDEEDIARALTPTKSNPMGGSGCAQNPEGLVLPGNKLILIYITRIPINVIRMILVRISIKKM